MATQLAAQLYTVRDFLKTETDIASSLKKVREIGYEAVQLSGLGEISPKEVRKICDDEGLTICATHESPARLTTEIEAMIEDHQIWGCKHTAYPWLRKPMRSEEGYTKLAAELETAGKKLAEVGMTVSYHNHAFEFEKYNGRVGLQIIYDESDSQFVKAEIDTYWVAAGGGDPADWIRRVKGRAPLVHLKDLVIVDEKPVFAEVGEGNINWPNVMDACKEAGVEWYIVEQDTCRRDPFESLKISLENLKSWGLQ